MTSELRVTTIANNAGSESVDTTYVVNGSVKAWADYEQTGTHSTLASLNVASITDTGTGRSTFSLTASISSANYALLKSVHDGGSYIISRYYTDKTSSAAYVVSEGVNETDYDADGSVAILGDLA